jgi:hypothetical protein
MESKKVTVENLTNSLAQIEQWVKAVRAALETMNPRTEIQLSDKLIRDWTETPMSPIKTARECPPPE